MVDYGVINRETRVAARPGSTSTPGGGLADSAGMPGPDYIVEIEGLRPPRPTDSGANPAGSGACGGRSSGGGSSGGGGTSGGGGRPWIAVTWKCCSVYSRIYRNRAGTCYEGRCPKCGKAVKARVGPGGTDNRFFQAG